MDKTKKNSNISPISDLEDFAEDFNGKCKKMIVIDVLFGYRRTALIENNSLKEIIVEEKEAFNIGDIFVAKVKKILPKKFAFVDIGDDKQAFLGLNDKKQRNLYEYNENTKKYNLTIKEGQDILVQIDKAGTETKGISLTTNLTLTGKYSVLLLNDNSVSISKKIEDKEKRLHIKGVVNDFISDFNINNEYGKYGAILRTNSEFAKETEILQEISHLIEKANKIINTGKYIKPPYLLYFGKTELEKLVLDVANAEDTIITNCEKEHIDFKKLFNNDVQDILLYREKLPIFDYFDIENKIQKAMQKKVWLKNGGFLVIEQVEAMTVIDVNTGKNTSKNFEKMVFDTNKSAVKQIAYELRLRNISGIVLIDFVDMKNEVEIREIEKLMRVLCRNDRMPIKIYPINELGIMQLTRKKSSKSLHEIVTKKCSMCGGNGVVKSETYIIHNIKNEIISIFNNTIYKSITLSSNDNIISKFKKHIDISEIEKNFDKIINLEIIQTGRFDYYNIDYNK